MERRGGRRALVDGQVFSGTWSMRTFKSRIAAYLCSSCRVSFGENPLATGLRKQNTEGGFDMIYHIPG